MKFKHQKRSAFIKNISIKGLLLIIMLGSTLTSNGRQVPHKPKERPEREEAPPIKERIFFGGSFGLQFGTFTDIEVSPIIGMWVLPRVGIAAGPNFRYYKSPFGHTTIYGGRAYLQYIFLQDLNNVIPLGIHAGLLLHFEDEALSLESAFFKTTPFLSDRFLVNTVLAGGGIRQQLGRRSSLNFMFLWALNESGYGIYGNPEIRIAIIF